MFAISKTQFRTKGIAGVCPWLCFSPISRWRRMFLAYVQCYQYRVFNEEMADHPRYYEMSIDAGSRCLWFKTIRILNNKYSVSSALKQTHEYLSPQAHGYFNTALLESI